MTVNDFDRFLVVYAMAVIVGVMLGIRSVAPTWFNVACIGLGVVFVLWLGSFVVRLVRLAVRS